jgi:putative ABC transport system substrate-binding protein
VRNAAVIITALLNVLSLPLWADAQQGRKVPKIGFFTPAPSSPETVAHLDAFRHGLRALGYVEGQNITIESRYAAGRLDRLPDLAAELVTLGVDIIVARGEAAARAAKQATGTIPIVMATSGDPVGTGLVVSLARPGGNVTGLSSMAPDTAGKRLQLLKQAVPRVSRVAFLYPLTFAASVLEVKEAQVTAPALGLTVHPLGVRAPDDLGRAFDAMTREHADALIIGGDPLTTSQQKRILEFAAKRRLPGMYFWAEFVQAGGLMAYGPSLPDMYRRAATYVDKILKGAKPADLPVEQPTKFELAINMKTAKALGLTIPPSVLVRADRVIQ